MTLPITGESLHVYQILALFASFAESYLGIGVQEGECVRHVVEANPTIDLTLCDTWGSQHGGTNRQSHNHIEEMLARVGHRGSVVFLDGSSQDEIPKLSGMFDLSFVDGDHSERGAYQDFLNVWPRTRKAMLVHDVFTQTVATALMKFFNDKVSSASQPSQVTYSSDGTGTAVVYR